MDFWALFRAIFWALLGPYLGSILMLLNLHLRCERTNSGSILTIPLTVLVPRSKVSSIAGDSAIFTVGGLSSCWVGRRGRPGHLQVQFYC